jgi:hypothetical protein
LTLLHEAEGVAQRLEQKHPIPSRRRTPGHGTVKAPVNRVARIPEIEADVALV